MHPRLRRQLASLRTELPPAFRQLIAAIDAHYREFDAERAELEESLASVTALLHRAQSRAAAARGRMFLPGGSRSLPALPGSDP